MKALNLLRKLSSRMFYRVFFTYSTIIFLTMAFLFVFLSDHYSEFIIQREVDKQATAINQIKSEIEKKHTFVQQGVYQLYREKHLIEDLAFALQHDYQQYMGYRLDKYSRSSSFVPYNFDIYVKNYFSRDSDIVALQVRNETLGTQYHYLYNYGLWKESDFYDEEERDLYGKDNDFFTLEEQINDPISLERLGTLTVYFTFHHIDRLLTYNGDPMKGSYYIIDEELNVVYSYGDVLDEALKEIDYRATQQLVNNRYLIQSSIEPSTGFMVASIVPRSELSQLFHYKITMFLLILLLTVVSIALPYVSLRGYLTRVNDLVQTMKEVQSGQLSVRIETGNVDDDLAMISNTFNETLDELEDYIEKVYFSKLKQTEAELANLQSQINPHFLYNTLEAIRMKSLSEGGRTTAKMIVQLSYLFRYSLKSADLVTIGDELQHVEQYVELFNIRFPNQLTFQVAVEEKHKHYVVPPFILQPLIENFLIHGFKRERDDNQINIIIQEHRQTLQIQIMDNGKGIPRKKVEEINERLSMTENSSHSIGLFNVNQRLRLRYGERFGVSVQSEPDVCTIVTIRTPMIISEVDVHDTSDAS
ncbi:sensor histidine kinase [Halalkalibacterium halodurans]|uniref:HAMP domain-containing protein n=1 Tax=Halalkalibacterium halodurans TaxID=86665 RepID=A0A0M0KBR6_ALKHA|nr:sensor histidine kinase [Halalkalibacterium halodurans]MED4163025.1 sensor histidine kinase [Halalkalibacterium halodurans]TES49995.1 sensor histidine kinase [Halalkalibacterium halodurans]TPE70256.1 sensor histidine kinase [Halalkalibacterium halodurans]